MEEERSPTAGASDLVVVAVGGEGAAAALDEFDGGVEVVETTAAGAPGSLGHADCLLCRWEGLADPRRLVAAADDAGVPVVACVADDGTGRAALEAGATEVYRDREVHDPTVLVRRVRAATAAVEDHGDDGGSLSPDTRSGFDGLETLVETIPDGAWVLDADGNVLAANDELLSTTGHDEAALVGRHVSALTDEDGAASVAAAASDPQDSPPVRVAIERSDGDRLPCEVSVRAVHGDDAGRTVGVVRTLDAGSTRERRVQRLVTATRELLTEGSFEGVVRTATAAAEDLRFDRAVFHRYDDRAGVLEPVASGGEGVSGGSSVPVEGTSRGRAFRSGSVQVEAADGHRRAHVPVGEYGVLSVDPPGELDVTDRRLAQLLAASTEAGLDAGERRQRLLRYEAVVERTAGKAFALDESDRFTLVSNSLVDHLGYDREDLLGRSFSTVLVDGDYDAIRPLSGTLQTAEGSRETYEVTATTAEGDRVPLEFSASLLTGPDGEYQGTVGIVRDISDLERARERLSDERDRFTYLFENLPDAVAEVEFVDGVGYVKTVNDRFEETFGRDGDTFVGENIDEFVLPPGLREEGRRINERAAAGEVITSSVRRLSVDGTRHFLLRVVPYDRSDGSTRSFAIYTDITAQKQRERYLRVVNRILRHNLRNDLNLVQGYAEYLVEALADPTLAEYAERIHETVDHITVQSETAREVQDTIRGDDRGPVPIDLVETTREVVERCRDQHSGAEVSVTAPESARIDAGDKVSLVVENLVENAIVHNVGDEARVEVTVSVDDEWVGLLVEDDGPGIPDAERAVVAEDREITQLEHGSGLGLWVVKWLVENYGGRIEFGDATLGGAAVQVRFRRSKDRS